MLSFRHLKHLTEVNKLLTFAFILLAVSVSLCFSQTRDEIVQIRAKVLKVGDPPPVVSGARLFAYQLVKYEVLKVLNGKLNEKEIVVDYVYFDKSIRGTRSKEWNRRFEVGKILTMWLLIKNEISAIWSAPGIREEGEEPAVFYLPTTKPK